uniref:clp protease proteolytic subunit n=1 Tax=Carex gibba TaxID=418163 RepID=UPI001F14039B|nr:clp protease proteolytic subunit [Carex gibba]ULQ64295.1 clp protease proteolytic subunit [Carex gibba]
MPLGIPKVPYKSRFNEKPIWIDIYERLYKERTLFLCKEITTPFTNRFIVLLLLLNSETYFYNDPDIYIYMNSPGGGVHESLTIYDTIKTILPDVCTIAMGATASVASLILAGGTITKRVALPHAKVMIHQPSSARVKGNIHSLKIEAEDMLELRNTIADIYAENTGKPVDIIQKDLERDYFMSATEAQDYGIIDDIVKSKKENEIKSKENEIKSKENEIKF